MTGFKTALAAAATLLAGAISPSIAAGVPAQGKVIARSRPDIVVIVLDDVGFSDLGAFGSEIRTPNIDALAASGLRYTRFDTKAICTPTRAALLTGRNNQSVGLADLPAAQPQPASLGKDRGELRGDAQTVAQALHDGGYATHAIGKWHLAPEFEDGTAGKNASWPLQRGFDDFYGFISGWTDQYHPQLVAGNRSLPPMDKAGYHLSSDLVDHAIEALNDRSRPNFVYLAFGAAHAPFQVPPEWSDHYAGAYDKGWNALRQDRFARMKSLGLLPPNTILPASNPGDRPWNSLSADEKAVFARFMEVYAGYIEHVDAQIGRLTAELRRSGRLDSTMIVLLSDNGASSEAGQAGTFNGLYKRDQPSPAEMRARIAEIGTDRTQAEYPAPWAMAGVTPYRRYKVYPYLGGVRTPLIVAWPGGTRDRNAIRRQYVDVTDIAPTLLDVAGLRFAETVDGVPQVPVSGVSFRATLASGRAPETRTVQYFELRGNRAITSGKWRAVAMHRDGTPFAADRWELFDLKADPAEADDLSQRNPKQLAIMQDLWWREARQYSDPPLVEEQPRFRGRQPLRDAFVGVPD